MVEFNLSKWNFRFQSTLSPATLPCKSMDFCVFYAVFRMIRQAEGQMKAA